MLKESDPGPNYAKHMDDVASKKEPKLPIMIILRGEHSDEKPKPSTTVEHSGENSNTDSTLNDIQVAHYAYHFFEIFKVLIVDLIFSFQERNKNGVVHIPESRLRRLGLLGGQLRLNRRQKRKLRETETFSLAVDGARSGLRTPGVCSPAPPAPTTTLLWIDQKVASCYTFCYSLDSHDNQSTTAKRSWNEKRSAGEL
ncbi:hypothetical protein LWI29_016048 [Acer saccharum]|uniref:Uncharacterized protein n=1 Tax=Acer saccharum TaxID=4024 RepID=A0AA39SVI3_ACESA|nr:hypothetical protein LWI29_016048 [Acer saccharum]